MCWKEGNVRQKVYCYQRYIWQCHIIMASQNQSLLKIFSFEKQVLELAEVRLTIVQQIYRVYYTYIHCIIRVSTRFTRALILIVGIIFLLEASRTKGNITSFFWKWIERGPWRTSKVFCKLWQVGKHRVHPPR